MSFPGTHEKQGQGDNFVKALKDSGRDDGVLSKAHFFPVTTKDP